MNVDCKFDSSSCTYAAGRCHVIECAIFAISIKSSRSQPLIVALINLQIHLALFHLMGERVKFVGAYIFTRTYCGRSRNMYCKASGLRVIINTGTHDINIRYLLVIHVRDCPTDGHPPAFNRPET
ncbi:hypothetical protein PILCRDRAFT_319388 [Piloderma croceum F 1598]|uniref:Uncharacterized protein n=1 Tax=Piloderma croceum (strain F 1598) TaxID=765440 RepID=A0A0C3FQ17_PILCF|nr:hypothetical protein PILCRDRAFT_319388 [Piloderma croceum F 1598]